MQYRQFPWEAMFIVITAMMLRKHLVEGYQYTPMTTESYDSQYRKRLEEYYQSIAEQSPQTPYYRQFRESLNQQLDIVPITDTVPPTTTGPTTSNPTDGKSRHIDHDFIVMTNSESGNGENVGYRNHIDEHNKIIVDDAVEHVDQQNLDDADPTEWSSLHGRCANPYVPNSFIKWMDVEDVWNIEQADDRSSKVSYYFQCNEGYEHDIYGAPLTVRCVDGRLTELPRCQQVEYCVKTPKPMHGSIDVDKSVILKGFMPGTYSVGTKLVFKCDQYSTPDPNLKIMASTCVRGGIWSHFPKCAGVSTCDLIPYLNQISTYSDHLILKYRSVILIKSPLHQTNYHAAPGSILRHTCMPSYEWDPNSGPMDVRCQKDGTWTDFPRCIPSVSFMHSCEGIPNQKQISERNLVGKVYKLKRIGSRYVGNVTFVCKDNHVPDDPTKPLMISCVPNGWTKLPSCHLRTLCPIDHPKPYNSKMIKANLHFIPEMRDKGYLPDSFVDFMYRPQRNQRKRIRTIRLRCLENGHWTIEE